MRVIVAMDKFRGTLTAAAAADSVVRACTELGLESRSFALADGGEGFLDAVGGANRTTSVEGPLGEPVDAPWRLDDGWAALEMASAAGLLLAGGAASNDPVGASTRGVGQLIDAALDAGVEDIVVGMGGSATTDGGAGALDAIRSRDRVGRVALTAACDVGTTFTDAARVFGPQKGATPDQVVLLTDRLETLADRYLAEYGVDVRGVPGTGAAGGLAGGLVALGARVVSGFDFVADRVGLREALVGADLVITGEGRLDRTSLDGKVVGGVQRLAGDTEVPAHAIVGIVDSVDSIPVTSLVDRFGRDAALRDTKRCLTVAAREVIRGRLQIG